MGETPETPPSSASPPSRSAHQRNNQRMSSPGGASLRAVCEHGHAGCWQVSPDDWECPVPEHDPELVIDWIECETIWRRTTDP